MGIKDLNIAEHKYRTGRHLEAIKWYEKVLPRIPRDDKNRLAKIYINLGHSYDYTGNIKKSQINYEKALQIARETKNKFGEVSCLVSLSLPYYQLYDYTKAISILEKAEKICLEIDYKKGLVDVYIQLAIIQDDFKRYTLAIKNILKAFDIIDEDRSAFEDHDLALAHKTLAAIYSSIGEYQKCRDNLEQARNYDITSKNEYSESMTLENLGITCLNQEDYTDSLTYLKDSIKLFVKLSNKPEVAWCSYNLGRAYRKLEDPNTEQTLNDTLTMAQQLKDLELIGLIHLELGHFYLNTNKIKSYYHLKISIMLHKKLRDKAMYYDHSAGLNSRLGHDAYDSLVSLCIDLGKNEEAFEILEEGKSIALIKLMRASKIEPKVKSKQFSSLLKQETEYLQQARMKQTTLTSNTEAHTDNEEFEQINKINELYNRMNQIDRDYVSLRRGKIVNVQELKQIATESDIIFVEYFISQVNNVFIFVVTNNIFDIKVIKLPYPISEYYKSFAMKVTHSDQYQNKISNISWTELSNYLINPIKEFLENNKIICFIPSGLLYYIPLHSLKLNGELIIKQHAIFYCASASLFYYYRIRRHPELVTCSVFARREDGFLFETEAKEIADLFRSQPIIDVKKEDLPLLIKDRDILHFATHGRFDKENPMHSYVRLNDTEILQAGEIFTLEINSSVVTLSACETGVSEIKSGDESIGLTHSLLYAGAVSVVVSLWIVEDDSTQELMKVFYKDLKKYSKVKSLQNAQIHLINQGMNIKQWSAFILVGNFE